MLLSGHLDLITLVNKGFMIYLKYFVSIRIKNDLSIFKRWEFISHCVLISLFHGEAINSENSFMFTPFSLSHATFCDIVKNNMIFVSLLDAILRQSRVGEMGQSFRSSGQSEYRTRFIFSKGAANHNIILLH